MQSAQVDALFRSTIRPDAPGCAVGVYRSGEIVLAFATAQRVPRTSPEPLTLVSVSNDEMGELFEGAVDATAESVHNSLTAAVTTVGRDGNVAYEVPLDRLVQTLRRAGHDARLPGV